MNAPGLWDEPTLDAPAWQAVRARLAQLFGKHWQRTPEGRHLEQYAAHLIDGAAEPVPTRRRAFLASQRATLAAIIERAGA